MKIAYFSSLFLALFLVSFQATAGELLPSREKLLLRLPGKYMVALQGEDSIVHWVVEHDGKKPIEYISLRSYDMSVKVFIVGTKPIKIQVGTGDPLYEKDFNVEIEATFDYPKHGMNALNTFGKPIMINPQQAIIELKALAEDMAQGILKLIGTDTDANLEAYILKKTALNNPQK